MSSSVTIENLVIDGQGVEAYSLFDIFGHTWLPQIKDITFNNITLNVNEGKAANILIDAYKVENINIKNVEYEGIPQISSETMFEFSNCKNVNVVSKIENSSIYNKIVTVWNGEGKIDTTLNGDKYDALKEVVSISHSMGALLDGGDNITVKTDKDILRQEYCKAIVEQQFDENVPMEIYSYALKGNCEDEVASYKNEIIKNNNMFVDFEFFGLDDLKGRNIKVYGISDEEEVVYLEEQKVYEYGSIKIKHDGRFKKYIIEEITNVSSISFRNSQAIKYIGNWTKGKYGQFTSENKAIIQYDFYGTGIRVHANNSGKIRVMIDGKDYGIVDLSQKESKWIVFNEYNLQEGLHNIKIETVLDLSNNEQFMFTGFDVLQDGVKVFKRIEEDDANIIKVGKWNINEYYKFSNASSIRANEKSATIEYSFEGT